MNLPTKLASLRKQKGLTQLELAEKLDVSRQAVSRWEAGSAVPSIDNLKILRDLYGVPIDYLLDDDADEPCKDAEKPNQEQKEQDGTSRSRKRKSIFTCALMLVMAIVIVICVAIICVMAVQGRQQEQIVPLEEMDTLIEDDYPAYTFVLEPIGK